MFHHRKNLIAAALGAVLLLSMTACTSADTDPTPAPSATDVDGLPLLSGFDDEAPVGWTPGSCRALSFAVPPAWQLNESSSYDDQKVFDNPAVASLVGLDGVGVLPERVRFNCEDEPSIWNGEPEPSEEFLSQDVAADAVETYRLDIPGAEHAVIWIAPKTGTGDSKTVEPGQEFSSAQILAVAPDGGYFTVYLGLATGEASSEIIRGVASSLSID
jgi:hypothetical protein